MNNYIASTVLMVSPDKFGFNIETAATNLFQKGREDLSPEEIKRIAMEEFINAVNTLKENDIDVLILPSRKDVETPDAVFPTNWFSHHEDGSLVIYPMLTKNRREEKQVNALRKLLEKHGITTNLIDLSKDEGYGGFLEGTGSLVLDRKNKLAFAMESERTTEEEFRLWCDSMGYDGAYFHRYNKKKIPIYHTSVMLAICDTYAIVCFEAIEDPNEKQFVKEQLEKFGKEIIEISFEQVFSFCGSVTQLQTKESENILILSRNVYNTYTPEQRRKLEKHNRLIPIEIGTIEGISGGSIHGMLAEIFT